MGRSRGPRGHGGLMLGRIWTALDAGDSLIEVMVGLVLIIGVTSSERIGFIDPDLGVDAVLLTALLVAVVWACIDGGFVLLASWFRQGRLRRLARLVAASGPDSTESLAEVRAIAGGALQDLLTPEEVDRVAGMISRSAALQMRRVRLTGDDWIAASAAVLAMLLATLPPVVPYLLPLERDVQTDVSNAIAILTLFWVGWFWARWTDFPRWVAGLLVAGVGMAMVALTVLFDVV